MSEAKVCDRCAAVEDKDSSVVDLNISFTRIHGNIPRNAHLCTDCKVAFRDWFAEVGDSA